MEVALTQIGNSQGIRIPQAFIKQLGFVKTVKLTIKDKSLILSPTSPRSSWVNAFTASPPSSSPTPYVVNQFDQKDWQW